MLDLELMLCMAILALERLNYLASLDESLFFGVAVCAQECSLFHFWDDISIPNDNASKRDHLVNVLRTELSDPVRLEEVVWPDLDEDIFLLFVSNHLLTAQVVHVEFLVDLRDHQIEDWDQVSGVVLDLAVELWVVLVNVRAVDVEDLELQVTHFLQLLDVVGQLGELAVVAILVDLSFFNEVVDELLEFLLDEVCLNVRAPEHLRVRSHLATLNVVELG